MIDSAVAKPSPPLLTPARVLARIAAGLLGGWFFVWGFVAAGIALLLAAGTSFNDARNLVHLLAFPVFLFVFCWAFLAAKLLRVWIVLLGGGTAMTLTAWLMTRTGV